MFWDKWPQEMGASTQTGIGTRLSEDLDYTRHCQDRLGASCRQTYQGVSFTVQHCISSCRLSYRLPQTWCLRKKKYIRRKCEIKVPAGLYSLQGSTLRSFLASSSAWWQHMLLGLGLHISSLGLHFHITLFSFSFFLFPYRYLCHWI